jgi:uncharacterized protein (DUF1800 family)
MSTDGTLMVEAEERTDCALATEEISASAPERMLLRRSLLTLGLGAVASGLYSSRAKAQASGGHNPTLDWVSPEKRLARRITMGMTAADAQLAVSLGYDGYLEYQLNHQAIDDSAVDAYLAASFPTLSYAEPQLMANQSQSQTELRQATVYRAIFSKRQLFERMVEFWSDHFNIFSTKVTGLKTADDRDVIRKNALSTFPALLRASAHSPAMMVYLDNGLSRIPIPNQNYARELMELHSLSVDGGYTQHDVEEVSRCLTGWTTVGKGVDHGKFIYNPAWHDNGPKTVLGTSIPANGGQGDGELVLQILAQHPSTARFISKKMLKWLLRYDPSPSQIDDVANVYIATNGDIKAMIRATLTQANLVAAPAKLKRPHHLVVSAIRATGASVSGLDALTALVSREDKLGHLLYNCDTPDGYPDKIEYWGGGLLNRWSFTQTLVRNSIKGVIVDSASFQGGGSASDIQAAINARLFGGEMSPGVASGLQSYLKARALTSLRVQVAIGLALGSPDFQWY